MTVISQVSLSKAGIFKEVPQNRSVIESMSSPTSGLAALMASLGHLPDPDVPTGYLKPLMHIPLPLCGVFRLPFRVLLGARAVSLDLSRTVWYPFSWDRFLIAIFLCPNCSLIV